MTHLSDQDLITSAQMAIDLLGPAPINWIPQGDADCDVAVVGGGQSGLAVAFALRRAGIHRVRVFDAAPVGGTGVWTTVARMRTLRTPKTYSGPELGIPQLSFRHWYTGRFGAAAYDAIVRIPRQTWQDYIDWYGKAVNVAVQHEHRLVDIAPSDQGLGLSFETPQGVVSISARRLVLATGMDGMGGPYVPPAVAANIPPSLRHHTAERIDFSRLAGKRVGVVGAAASAFDAASTALEHGAAELHQFVRAPQLPEASQPLSGWSYQPSQAFFFDYPDRLRWTLISQKRRTHSAPEDSIARARAHAGHQLHISTQAENFAVHGTGLMYRDATRSIELDHLILGTGYQTRLELRPELARVAPHVLLWRHRDVPPECGDESWGQYPYVGRGFELVERSHGTAPWLERVHVFNFASILSHGWHVGDVGSLAYTVPRLVEGVSRGLFEQDRALHETMAISQLTSATSRPLP